MHARLYFNLHRKCLSLQVNGIVENHVATAIMTDVTFVVSAAGRARVLREKAKNVHAFVCGQVEYVDETWEHVLDTELRATYNPYKYASFVTIHDKQPVFTAKRVLVSGRDIYILEP